VLRLTLERLLHTNTSVHFALGTVKDCKCTFSVETIFRFPKKMAVAVPRKALLAGFHDGLRNALVECRKKKAINAAQAKDALEASHRFRLAIDGGILLAQEIKLSFTDYIRFLDATPVASFDALLRMVEDYIGRLDEQLSQHRKSHTDLTVAVDALGVELEAHLPDVKGLVKLTISPALAVEIDLRAALFEFYRTVCTRDKVRDGCFFFSLFLCFFHLKRVPDLFADGHQSSVRTAPVHTQRLGPWPTLEETRQRALSAGFLPALWPRCVAADPWSTCVMLQAMFSSHLGPPTSRAAPMKTNATRHPVHCHLAFWRPHRRSHATCPHFQVYIHHLFKQGAWAMHLALPCLVLMVVVFPAVLHAAVEFTVTTVCTVHTTVSSVHMHTTVHNTVHTTVCSVHTTVSSDVHIITRTTRCDVEERERVCVCVCVCVCVLSHSSRF
jgi:hypothetical protein